MAESESDPGGDTGMFQAFVNSSQSYEQKSMPRGPIVVAAVALGIAVLAFILIVAIG